MEQGVPGSQNEPFFELLHPKAERAAPPTSSSSSSVDATINGSPPQDPSPLHDIPPSYDFHLSHSSKSSDAMKSGDVGAKSEDPPPFLYRASSLEAPDSHRHAFQGSTLDAVRGPDHGKPMEVTDAWNQVTMAAIDRTMKNYTDNLLHVLESVSGRLSQLETTVQGLEHTISGLKSTEGEKQDQSNVRLLKLEQLIEEVHTGVQLLHDKQKLDEAKSQLTKLHLNDQKPAIGGVSQPPTDGWQQPRFSKEEVQQVAYAEPPPQLAQHLPPQYPPQAHSQYPHAPPPPPPQMQAFVASQPMPSSMNGPSNPTTQQSYPPTVQHLPAQPSMQQVPPPAPQHSMPISSFHSQPPPQPPPQSSYNLPMETAAYSHMQPQHHHPAAPTPYLPEPPQYPAGTHGGPRQQPMPQEVLHPSQQHSSVGPQHMYESAAGRVGHTASSMPPSYAQVPAPKPVPPVSMYETASGGGYGTPSYRAAQPVPSAPSGGGASYPRLPTAQPLQHGLPASSGGSSGPSSRSPLDEVIERVVAMGFSREQVRAVVRQLTENGQSVDMNVVLDKLMNGENSTQAPRGWFGRG
eukprot:c15971_g1_i1 orf=221-1942(-)